MKTCPQYGAGFFVVPGTTSCLKIIGRVRADYIALNALTRSDDSNVFRARGYFGYDHRTPLNTACFAPMCVALSAVTTPRPA